MTQQEKDDLLKLIGETATRAASEATNQALGAKTKELASAADLETLKKEIEANSVELKKVGDSLVKVSNGIAGVSIKDIGGGQSELGFNRAKMWRGVIRGNWSGADKEKEILHQVRAVAGSDGDTGGYALPTELYGPLFQLIRDRNVIPQLGVLNVSPRSMRFEIPGVSQGSVAYMIGEGKPISESDLKFKLIALTPKKAAALLYVSMEMLDAADPGFTSILEADMAAAIADIQMQQFLYGDGSGNCPIGVANQIASSNVLATGATGDSPTQAFFRTLRGKIPQKYVSPNFRFLMNDLVAIKTAAVKQSEATTVLATDEQLVANALGKPFVTSGHVKADKTKSTGHDLSDVFYGKWDEVVFAQWGAGLRVDMTEVGGKSFEQGLVGIRAILPFDLALRRTDALAKAPFVQTTNS